MHDLGLVCRRAGTIVFIVLFAGCSSTAAQQARGQGPNDVVATVGSSSITLAQVDEKAMRMPADTFGTTKLFQAIYDARRATLEDIINNMLIDQDAKDRGIERAKLLEQEVAAKVAQPTDAEIATWYEANPERVKGATLDQVRSPIKSYLLQGRTDSIREQYLNRVKSKVAVRMLLEPPRQVVATAGHHARGPENAPIELVEFADFQCPFCFRAHPTVEQVLNTYGSRIHFVYRHFPLSNHPNARPAAEAAECAAEQDKFWPYYQLLFADANKLDVANLKTYAAQLGMDQGRFDACLDSHKYRDTVDKDAKEGEQAGVSGTPAFFINGRLLSGAQPFEEFKRMIDEELTLRNVSR